MISGDVLGERARLTPAKVALVTIPGGRRFTYRELDDRAMRCAQLWRGLGLRPGDRIGILAHNLVEYVDAFFAAGKTGIILVPLSTRLTGRELAAIAADAGLRALMYAAGMDDKLAPLRDAAIEHWIALDGNTSAADIQYADAAANQPIAGFRPYRCDPEDAYCLLYTSGTTGQPKGVVLPHRMIAFNGYNTAACWGLRDDDVAPIFTPMYHAGGLSVFLVPIFTVGGTVVLHERFDVTEVWRAVADERATVIFAVPTIFKMLMDAPEFTFADIGSVRWCISGGAPLPAYIVEAWRNRGVVFKQGYGLTEVGVNCFSMTTEDSARKPGSIGKPMMFTEARLIGPAGADVAVGETGELLLRGPHVCRGYWNNPDATAAAIDAAGWFHTGDLARRDEDGFFYIAGRLKEMLISGGVNVYPAEIERELVAHPAVEDAAVVGVPDDKWGEVGVAFVVLRPDQQATERQLAEYLEHRLAKLKIPKSILFVDSLPRTAYGKVMKPELRARYLAQRQAAGEST